MAIVHLSAFDLRVLQRDLHHLCWLLADMREKSQPHHAAVFADLVQTFVLPFLAVPVPPGSRSVAAVNSATIAIGENGELSCFGRADFELPAGPFLSVHAGENHLCALRTNGELVYTGELELEMPEELGPVIAVASGVSHACAVKASGELVCFGENDQGQCDVPADLGPVVGVAAGMAYTCALTAAGDVVCFGFDFASQYTVHVPRPPGLGSMVLLRRQCGGPPHLLGLERVRPMQGALQPRASDRRGRGTSPHLRGESERRAGLLWSGLRWRVRRASRPGARGGRGCGTLSHLCGDGSRRARVLRAKLRGPVPGATKLPRSGSQDCSSSHHSTPPGAAGRAFSNRSSAGGPCGACGGHPRRGRRNYRGTAGDLLDRAQHRLRLWLLRRHRGISNRLHRPRSFRERSPPAVQSLTSSAG